MEYEENVDGKVKYLYWNKGTVMEYDKFNEYLVQFADDVDRGYQHNRARTSEFWNS